MKENKKITALFFDTKPAELGGHKIQQDDYVMVVKDEPEEHFNGVWSFNTKTEVLKKYDELYEYSHYFFNVDDELVILF